MPDSADLPTGRSEPLPTAPQRTGFLNPYIQIGISIVLSAGAQLLLKRGADDAEHETVLGFSGLLSGWVWLGIFALIGSLVSWLYALRFIALNVAYNLTGLIHVLVPLSCWMLLDEKISPLRWLGILLVVAGVVVTARPLVRIEGKL